MTGASEQQQYDELVDLCYECALNSTSWQPLLERLVTASGHHKIVLFHASYRNRDSQAATSIKLYAPGRLNSGIDPPWQLASSLDFGGSRTLGTWHTERIDFGSGYALQDPPSFVPHGLYNVASVRLDEQADSGIYLAAFHQVGAPAPTARHHALLERITPHLLKAIKLSTRINYLELELAKRDLLLDQHTAPLWLLDGEGQVLHSNQAARLMSLSGSPLYERSAHLHSTIQDALLRTLIRRAAGKDNKRRQAGWLRLNATQTQELLVTPVPAEADYSRHFNTPLVLLALLKNRVQSELFQLSPAELRLAELLSQGLTLEGSAARLNVSINTVRTQLRALFRKTDTTRQAQLTNLFTRLIGG
ncbi:Bacterial regulatory protein, luxR family [compost metagenome]